MILESEDAGQGDKLGPILHVDGGHDPRLVAVLAAVEWQLEEPRIRLVDGNLEGLFLKSLHLDLERGLGLVGLVPQRADVGPVAV